MCWVPVVPDAGLFPELPQVLRTHYVVQPALNFWDPSCNGYDMMRSRPTGFSYTSGANDRWVDPDEIKQMILELDPMGIEDLRREWVQPAARHQFHQVRAGRADRCSTK
jgi:hypothetical protein